MRWSRRPWRWPDTAIVVDDLEGGIVDLPKEEKKPMRETGGGSGGSPGDTTMNDFDRSSVAAKVIAGLSAALPADSKGKAITEESLLREELGLDSLGTVDLMIQLEDQFGISIEPDDFGSLRTVADVVQLIENKAKAKSAARS